MNPIPAPRGKQTNTRNVRFLICFQTHTHTHTHTFPIPRFIIRPLSDERSSRKWDEPIRRRGRGRQKQKGDPPFFGKRKYWNEIQQKRSPSQTTSWCRTLHGGTSRSSLNNSISRALFRGQTTDRSPRIRNASELASPSRGKRAKKELGRLELKPWPWRRHARPIRHGRQLRLALQVTLKSETTTIKTRQQHQQNGSTQFHVSRCRFQYPNPVACRFRKMVQKDFKKRFSISSNRPSHLKESDLIRWFYQRSAMFPLAFRGLPPFWGGGRGFSWFLLRFLTV